MHFNSRPFGCAVAACLLVGTAGAQGFPLSSVNVTSDYGPRNVSGGSFFHKGIDFTAANGTNVFSVDAGTVAAKSYFVSSPSLYHLRVNHAGGLSSRYLHIICDDVSHCPGTSYSPVVNVGSSVTQGQHIALSDSTGTSQPHLHLDMTQGGSWINPLQVLPYSNPGPPAIAIAEPMDDPGGMMPLKGKIRIKAAIDTASNGLDLNRVAIYVDSITAANEIAEFTYVPKSANIVRYDGKNEGVRPVGNTPGNDEFYAYWNSAERNAAGTDLKYRDGQHEIIVLAEDIQGMAKTESIAVETENKKQIAFVIDDTGSMGDEIAAVKSAAIGFVDTLSADPENFAEYLLWTFKDDVSFRGSTTDPATMVGMLSSLGAGGGNDCPEAAGAALQSSAIFMEEGGQVLLYTDASPREGFAFLDSVVASMSAQDIAVNTFVFGTCVSIASGGIQNAYEFFARLSEETGGLHFPITSAQIPDAMEIVLPALVRDGLVDIAGGELPPGGVMREIPVDVSVATVSFVLNSDGGSLRVFRPDATEVMDGDADTVFESTPGSVRITVQEPAVGIWTAEIDGDGEYDFAAEIRSGIDLSIDSELDPDPFVPVPIAVTVTGGPTSIEGIVLTVDGELITTFPLFDDGMHDDGGAGDGMLGGAVPASGPGSYRVGVRGTGSTYLAGTDLPDDEVEGEEYGVEGESPIPIVSEPYRRVDPRVFTIEAPPYFPCFEVGRLWLHPIFKSFILHAAIDPGPGFDPSQQALLVELTDPTGGQSFAYPIPLGGFQSTDGGLGRHYEYETPYGAEPDFRARFDLLRGELLFDVSSGSSFWGVNGPELFVRVSSSGSGVGEAVVPVTSPWYGWLIFERTPFPDCLRGTTVRGTPR